MLWQAEARFRFRLVGGHFALRVTPQEEEWRDVYTGLGSGRVAPRRFRAFLAAHHVDRIVVAPNTRPAARRLIEAVGASPPDRVLDTLVYHGARRPEVAAERTPRTPSLRPQRTAIATHDSVESRRCWRLKCPLERAAGTAVYTRR